MDSRYRPIADAVLQAEVPGHVDNLRVEGGGDEEPSHQDVSVTLEALVLKYDLIFYSRFQ